MTRWISVLMVVGLLVSMCPVALAESLAAVQEVQPKASYALGSRVTLTGKIKVYPKTKTEAGYVLLALDEPGTFTGFTGSDGKPAQYANCPDIQLVAPLKNNGKRAQVTGTLAAGGAGFQRPYVLQGASMKVYSAAKSVTINKKSASIAVKGTLQLAATVKPASAEQKVTWSSGNGSVAHVTANGLVTAVSAGQTTVTAKADNGKKASIKVTVVIPVTGVALSAKTATVTKGKKLALQATVSPAEASNKGITWSSSNKAIATVTGKGVVAGKKAGVATITATTKDGRKTATAEITVVNPPTRVKKIAVSPASASIGVKGEKQLTVKFTPAAPTNTQVIWKSSDESVATVSDKGLVTGHKKGTAIITVTSVDGGKKATSKITVVIPVSGVSLSNSSISVTKGNKAQLTATVSPADASNKAVTWTSSAKSVATVSSAGVVTGKKAGTATITAATKDGNKIATCVVTVTNPPVKATKVTVSPASATIEAGKTQQLSAAVSPSNATDKTVSWSSSNTSIATVSASGLVTAVKAGTATITATTKDGSNKKASCAVTVKAATGIAVTGVTVSPSSASIVVGKTQQLAATVSPSNATDKTVSWSSSNTSIATVGASGLVTAVKAGTAMITATTKDGQKKASCAVTVTAGYVPVTSVTLNPASVTLKPFDELSIRSTVLPYGASNWEVTWSTSDASVARLQSSSSSSVSIVGLKPGKATITATSKDNNTIKGTCVVTVLVPDEPLEQIWFTYPDSMKDNVMLFDRNMDDEVSGFILYGSQSMQIILGGEPKYVPIPKVTWTSSNPAVATVDANGLVKAVGSGYAVIKAATGIKNAAGQAIEYVSLCFVTPAKAAPMTLQDLYCKFDNASFRWPSPIDTITALFPDWVRNDIYAGQAFTYSNVATVFDRYVSMQYWKNEANGHPGMLEVIKETRFSTYRGMRIGSSLEQVLAAYGRPNAADVKEASDRCLSVPLASDDLTITYPVIGGDSFVGEILIAFTINRTTNKVEKITIDDDWLH